VAISTTIGAVGLNNTECNIVLMDRYYYGLQTLVQSSSRAGRKGQRGEAIFFHCRKSFGRGLAAADEWKALSYHASGIALDVPEIAKSLSLKSMETYFNEKECKFLSLCEGMDNCQPDAIEDGYYCLQCTRCTAHLQENFVIHWKKQVDAVPATSENTQELRIQAPENPEQRNIAQERRNLEHQFLETWFFALKETNCCWHRAESITHRPDHLFQDSRMQCAQKLKDFMGLQSQHSGQSLCFKCGDIYMQGCPGGKHCPYKRFFEIGDGGNAMCRFCLFPGNHQNSQCPREKAWFLVVWALRSNDGYQQVKSAYENINTTGDFPDQIPFQSNLGEQTLERNLERWWHARDWLCSHETTRFHFWIAIYTVLSELNID